MSTARPKTGRRASKAERARAQKIIDLYIQVRDHPEAAPEWTQNEKMRQHVLSPLYFLQCLWGFAEHGTFGGGDVRHMIAGWVADRCGSDRFEDKVQAVIAELHVSERTAARLLRRREIECPRVK